MPGKIPTQKSDPMLGALAASFAVSAKDQPQQKKAEEKKLPQKPKEKKESFLLSRSTQSEPTSVGVKKTTVSLHQGEQDKIDQILDSLKQSRRHRGGFSDAIKIALKLCPLNDKEIAQAWDSVRAQDLRILRHKRNA